MRCKFCGAELVEETTVCAECGKDNAKDSLDMLQKKVKNMRLALMIVLIVAILGLLAALTVFLVKEGMVQSTDPSTQPSTQATIPADGNPDDETAKGTYTYSDEEVKANHDTVVATMADTKLTSGQFQVYYWNAVYDFLSEYGSYASYLGIDVTKPLEQQVCNMFESPITWQQCFVKQGLSSWQAYQSLSIVAKAAGFEMPDTYKKNLEDLPTKLEEVAKEGKFDSVQAMLTSDYGPGVTYEDYYAYMELYYYANSYYEHLHDTAEVTDDQLQAYFDAQKDAIKENYGLEAMSGTLVSVRHILITPGEGSTYTDEQWEACRVKAQGIYDGWINGGMGEEAFIQLCKENSKDGNAADGGIYNDVYPGQMVKEYNDWCFDASRQPGDHGLVKTQFGYHIMFFVKSYEGVYPPIISGARADYMSKYLADVQKNTEFDIKYESITLNKGNLGQA